MFSILDAKCGFWQVPLSEESSKLTTFMTPVGRYAFLRMPYGISTGSEVFQRCMEQLFEGQPCKDSKLMSKIYRALSKIDESVSLPIAKWEADLSVSWDHHFWSQICLKTFELIRNPGLQLIQYKILHRVHYTGHRMFRMGFTASNNCSHCKGNTPDNYIHALWFCPPVQRYWYRICEDLSKCLKCSIPASPLVCLLGDLDGVTTEDNTIHMAFTALCIAKKTVLMNWKNKIILISTNIEIICGII